MGVLMNSIFESCTKNLDIYFYLGLTVAQLLITDTDLSSFSEGPSAENTAWQFCCLLSWHLSCYFLAMDAQLLTDYIPRLVKTQAIWPMNGNECGRLSPRR